MKIILKNIAIVFCLILFLVSTCGISVVRHYCSTDRENFLFVYSTNPSCSSHHHNHNHDKCCSEKSDKNDDANCCKNEYGFFKVADNFVDTDKVVCQQPIADFVTILFDIFNDIVSSTVVKYIFNPIDFIFSNRAAITFYSQFLI